MHNHQIQQLKKYGMTTAIISFLLSGIALGCLILAFLKFDQVPIIQNVITNWHDAPIVDITSVDKELPCPDDYQYMTNTEWPGTLDFCQCYEQGKVEQTTIGQCTGKAPNCSSFQGSPPQRLQILNGRKYCILREKNPVDYSRLSHADIETGQCPDYSRVCGEGNTICYPSQLQCPINFIAFQSKKRHLIDADQGADPGNQGQDIQQDKDKQGQSGKDQKEKGQDTDKPDKPTPQRLKPSSNDKQISITLEFNNLSQIVATNIGYGTPIVEFQWGYGNMCLNPSFYSKTNNQNEVRSDFFWLLDKSHIGCPQVNKQLGSKDTRWQQLLTQDEQGLFNQNGVNDSYRDMPNDPNASQNIEASTAVQSLFYRRYFKWTDQCWIDEIRRPHRLQQQSSSLRDIHFQILTLMIMAAAVFIIVGLIYPLLTCCCHCCGNETLNSYKLFLASKGVASVILVGGFIVLMLVFIQKPYKFNSNFKHAECSDDLTNKMIQESDKSVDQTFMFESISFISLSILLVVEVVMAGYYCCAKSD